MATFTITGSFVSGGSYNTLASIRSAISDLLQDAAYTDLILTSKINAAVANIAAGIRMPDGQVSPPLPDLFTMGSATTSLTLPYVSLPADYQRHVCAVVDSSGNRVYPPHGGDYYSFALFSKQISNLNMAEAGSVYRVAVKGTKLYYQGIPSIAEILSIHYYKKPTAMFYDHDTPDGIPDHLAERLIKHRVIAEIYGDQIEAGVTEPSRGAQYHETKFMEAMIELCDYIGIDGEPQYYGDDDNWDMGDCD